MESNETSFASSTTQTAIVVEIQVTRIPTVLKKTLIQETNGLLKVESSI